MNIGENKKKRSQNLTKNRRNEKTIRNFINSRISQKLLVVCICLGILSALAIGATANIIATHTHTVNNHVGNISLSDSTFNYTIAINGTLVSSNPSTPINVNWGNITVGTTYYMPIAITNFGTVNITATVTIPFQTYLTYNFDQNNTLITPGQTLNGNLTLTVNDNYPYQSDSYFVTSLVVGTT